MQSFFYFNPSPLCLHPRQPILIRRLLFMGKPLARSSSVASVRLIQKHKQHLLPTLHSQGRQPLNFWRTRKLGEVHSSYTGQGFFWVWGGGTLTAPRKAAPVPKLTAVGTMLNFPAWGKGIQGGKKRDRESQDSDVGVLLDHSEWIHCECLFTPL